MVLQGASRVWREGCEVGQGRAGDFEEVRGEERDVLPPLAQRRDFYHYSAQPIVEVRPELPAGLALSRSLLVAAITRTSTR